MVVFKPKRSILSPTTEELVTSILLSELTEMFLAFTRVFEKSTFLAFTAIVLSKDLFCVASVSTPEYLVPFAWILSYPSTLTLFPAEIFKSPPATTPVALVSPS